MDENDPTKYKEDHPYKKTSLQHQKYAIFFMSVPEESASKNTPENRKRWAEGLWLTNNLPELAREYTHGGAALNVGSDITPLDSASLPPLSKFLTIADTMAVISLIYRDNTTGENATAADIMEWPECIAKYFTKEQIPLLRQMYPGSNRPGTEWFNFNLSPEGSPTTSNEKNTFRREADPLNDF